MKIEDFAGADYVLDGSGKFFPNDSASRFYGFVNEIERARSQLSASYTGARLAQLFLDYPWLDSIEISLSAESEYNDEGGYYFTVSLGVPDSLTALKDAEIPEDLLNEAQDGLDVVFDEIPPRVFHGLIQQVMGWSNRAKIIRNVKAIAQRIGASRVLVQ